ncbi:hypothetical protein BSK59_13535 [Paenibacillus odorifer]|uniref:hypothetical protein n=1 Tax=Paenibacillus odorifer TaxID=189426 RepID=UPI00096C107E|nr:hypothetical protein [Paenibacillus odorifer]OME55493.1 hypothetical protein BSK59_13535 [Paenibacillus odorifer]
MLTIEYIGSGKAYSDFEVEEKAKEIIDTHLEYLDQDMIYRTSTENLIGAVRLYVVENNLDPESWLQFKSGEKPMKVNKFGNPDYWEKGFCDFSEKRAARILKAQIALRKQTQ